MVHFGIQILKRVMVRGGGGDGKTKLPAIRLRMKFGSSKSESETFATYTPRRGSIVTNHSAESICSASRIGARLTCSSFPNVIRSMRPPHFNF